MPTPRTRVYYCDDQQRFIDAFVEAHSGEFEIHSSLDISCAKAEVQKLIDRGERPDVILLDMFHPKPGPDFEARCDLAKRKLEELADKVREVRPYVNAAWRARGLDALKELRTLRALDRVPILFYTQRGLVFLSETELTEMYAHDADWMMKDEDFRSPATERARLTQMAARYRRADPPPRRPARDAAIALAAIAATAVAAAFLQGPLGRLHDALTGLFG